MRQPASRGLSLAVRTSQPSAENGNILTSAPGAAVRAKTKKWRKIPKNRDGDAGSTDVASTAHSNEGA